MDVTDQGLNDPNRRRTADAAAHPGQKSCLLLFLALASLVVLQGCGEPVSQSPDEPGARPMRIVSLDYCADQYVLKFVERERILAVSPDATEPFSFMRDAAVGVPVVRPVAEDVLILKPDLVVRAYGGGPNATAFFERAGIPVLRVGWASNIDGTELNSITTMVDQISRRLGSEDQGRETIRRFRARLAAIDRAPRNQTALYMTPAGVTTGPGSLIHQILDLTGYRNFQGSPGWQPLPLERLAYEQPDIVAAAFFATRTNHPHNWSASRHPLARQQLNGRPSVHLEGAWTACGGWFIIEAVEALAAGPVLQ